MLEYCFPTRRPLASALVTLFVTRTELQQRFGYGVLENRCAFLNDTQVQCCGAACANSRPCSRNSPMKSTPVAPPSTTITQNYVKSMVTSSAATTIIVQPIR